MIKEGHKIVVKQDCQIESAIFKAGEIYTVTFLINRSIYDIKIKGNTSFDVYGDLFPLSRQEFEQYFILLAELREQQIKTILDE